MDPTRRRRPGNRLTAPEDPERGVSQDEFQELVRDIEHETGPATGRVAAKPRSKARPKAEPEPTPPAAEPEPVDPTADALPEDLVLKDDKRDRPKRSRNRRHGRPR
ncbi:hypothetical protein FSW04_15830 [Baekduia soli]|uniref:Uncharacterized protein n=1 Tax=Baekduia soli TaxID=496014 RepID=A0A5B8U6X4_9ACTN|nr:hypothetical protein [Baekduia soli]QEC48899.1 hypothetical protein FSW04_15830 [Baekduia soli]